MVSSKGDISHSDRSDIIVGIITSLLSPSGQRTTCLYIYLPKILSSIQCTRVPVPRTASGRISTIDTGRVGGRKSYRQRRRKIPTTRNDYCSGDNLPDSHGGQVCSSGSSFSDHLKFGWIDLSELSVPTSLDGSIVGTIDNGDCLGEAGVGSSH